MCQNFFELLTVPAVIFTEPAMMSKYAQFFALIYRRTANDAWKKAFTFLDQTLKSPEIPVELAQ